MTVWRLHTETASGKISRYCIENDVAAVGWCFSPIYTEANPELEEKIRNIKTFSDYWEILENFSDCGDEIYSVRRLAEEVRPGDFIWLHSEDGHYYIAKVSENSKWQFIHDARDKDAANQISNIKWHEVKDELIPQIIREAFQRGSTFQRILAKEAETFSERLFPREHSA